MDLSIDCLLPPDNEFQKLDLLLSQGSFELVNYQPDQKVQDLKLVYLMNDAAESFLVFQKARLTGEYLKKLTLISFRPLIGFHCLYTVFSKSDTGNTFI